MGNKHSTQYKKKSYRNLEFLEPNISFNTDGTLTEGIRRTHMLLLSPNVTIRFPQFTPRNISLSIITINDRQDNEFLFVIQASKSVNFQKFQERPLQTMIEFINEHLKYDLYPNKFGILRRLIKSKQFVLLPLTESCRMNNIIFEPILTDILIYFQNTCSVPLKKLYQDNKMKSLKEGQYQQFYV